MNAPSVPVPDVPVPDVPAPVPAPGPRLFNSKLYDPENIPLAIRHMQIIRIFPHPKTNVGRFVYLYWGNATDKHQCSSFRIWGFQAHEI